MSYLLLTYLSIQVDNKGRMAQPLFAVRLRRFSLASSLIGHIVRPLFTKDTPQVRRSSTPLPCCNSVRATEPTNWLALHSPPVAIEWMDAPGPEGEGVGTGGRSRLVWLLGSFR